MFASCSLESSPFALGLASSQQGGQRWAEPQHRLAKSVQRLRKERGWSQEALTDAAGLDRAQISGIERMARNPTITMVERVAQALGCKAGNLLDEHPSI